MKPPNVEHLLVFRKNGDQILSPQDLQNKYKFEPDGTNQYYAINAANVSGFEQSETHSALNPTQRGAFDDLLSRLIDGPAARKTIVLGLEPDTFRRNNRKEYLYDAAVAHPDLLAKLATELAEMQAEAKDAGKRFDIIIRYASEMNDTALPLADRANAYKSTFATIRRIFAEKAPGVLFSFSPALRADLPEPAITQFWPGNALVDVIAGTWYIGAPSQRTAAIKNMTNYFLHRKGAGKPFALSEVGGCNANGAGNDAVLKDMFGQLGALAKQGVSFSYVTIFVEAKYGTDATLRFITA